MHILADRSTTVNRRQNDWSTGFNLYADRQPITRCANNAQRRGWRDGQAGERACAVLDTAAFLGVNPSDADAVLAREW